MPRVTFVNEHRAVDAASGASLRDVAREAGIALGGVCWVDGAVSARTFGEALRGMRGWRRSPGAVRVLGDVKVYSTPAAANRVGVARAIDPPPNPVNDATAARGAIPTSIPHPPESKPNAARPISTIPPPPETE